MASIKAIEGRSVHQIQSGQVIVDLCSVAKELVENSLDAKASSIEVRFKNSGLDSIEVQDNGAGIGPEDFESIALKHHTSKLSSYDDLTSLNTFGFRGEALSSMCALSDFYVITARECDRPKGTRLDFEVSGRLKSQTVVASSKGTTVVVERLFGNLPVRRKELERNIKREYQKVLVLLNAYACISAGVRFNVSNMVAKGKRNVVFSTQGHSTTLQNIANVFSSKATTSLLTLNLTLELQPSTIARPAIGDEPSSDILPMSREVLLTGHISRPVVGEGRQAPDRQMFFVNSRPCQLPQVARAINEVYKSYNITQSPFIFANLVMDTNAYDVNVSPDKRTILLHDQTVLLEALKSSLAALFDEHEQSVPQGSIVGTKIPIYRPLTVIRQASANVDVVDNDQTTSSGEVIEVQSPDPGDMPPTSMLRKFVARNIVDRDALRPDNVTTPAVAADSCAAADANTAASHSSSSISLTQLSQDKPLPWSVQEFNKGMGDAPSRNKPAMQGQHSSDAPGSDSDSAESDPSQSADQNSNQVYQRTPRALPEAAIASLRQSSSGTIPGSLQSAYERPRPRQLSEDTATITIGNITTTAKIGSPATNRRRADVSSVSANKSQRSTADPILLKSLRAFAAPGSQMSDRAMDDYDLQATASTSEASDVGSDLSDSDGERSQDDNAQKEQEVNGVDNAESGTDDEYIDDIEKKRREEARVARLIKDAEATAARPTADNLKRATAAFKGRLRKDATVRLVHVITTSSNEISNSLRQLTLEMEGASQRASHPSRLSDTVSAEERLALTVSKSDFERMRIVGQFNLGFILAVRPPNPSQENPTSKSAGRNTEELFIIDQHASDEKYNFERLQAITVVQNQPLVRPRELDLTAVDEEIILNHRDALVKNGFNVEVDMSGSQPVGRRCRLISLPMSREVTFGTPDLEELLALLADHAISEVPRPSKVRRMFAMRACRSSIMIGKTLQRRQMEDVVRHMGEIDKPWNCPHGRPTMRHLFGLDSWQSWHEGHGLVGMGVQDADSGDAWPWSEFVEKFDAAEESEKDSSDSSEDDG